MRTVGVFAALIASACGRIGFDTQGPTLDLDVTLGDASGIHVERPTPATYVDATGIIRVAVPNEPRFDHDPMTGAPLGLLIEGARTNLVRGYSAELQVEPPWFVNGVGRVLVDAAVAPDGTMSAEAIFDEDAVDDQRRAALLTIPDDDRFYTYSVFLRAGTVATWTFGAEILGGSQLVQVGMTVDLASGQITEPPSAPAFGIEPYPGGWYRVWIAIRNTASENDYGVLSIWGDLENPAQTGSVFAWGAQVEQGRWPSSYIPAQDAETARAADVVRTVDTDWLVPGAGTVRITADVNREERTPRAALCLGGEGERTCLGRTSEGRSAVANGASDDTQLDTTALVGEPWPVATAHTMTTSLRLPPVDEVRLGGTPALDGHVRRLVYWPYESSGGETSANEMKEGADHGEHGLARLRR